MAPKFAAHVFVCQNERPAGHGRGCCLSKGSDKIAAYMKARVKELGLTNIRVNKSGCLDQCEQGPAIVIYPQQIWCTLKTTQDVDQLIQRLLVDKTTPTELMMS